MSDDNSPSSRRMLDSNRPFVPRFSLGQVVATPGALRTLAHHEIDIVTLLLRHVSGDWGELCAEDQAQNELAVLQGHRLLSAYSVGSTRRPEASQSKVWIITEWDRSVTTVLLPSEY